MGVDLQRPRVVDCLPRIDEVLFLEQLGINIRLDVRLFHHGLLLGAGLVWLRHLVHLAVLRCQQLDLLLHSLPLLALRRLARCCFLPHCHKGLLAHELGV